MRQRQLTASCDGWGWIYVHNPWICDQFDVGGWVGAWGGPVVTVAIGAMHSSAAVTLYISNAMVSVGVCRLAMDNVTVRECVLRSCMLWWLLESLLWGLSPAGSCHYQLQGVSILCFVVVDCCRLMWRDC